MIAKIIIDAPFLNKVENLTYSIPKEISNNCFIGSICTVPFRNKFVTGIITDILDDKFCDQPKLKKITSVSHLTLQKWQINLATWISNQYQCPIYKALKLFLPQNMWKGNLEQKTPSIYQLAITKNEAKEFVQTKKRFKNQCFVIKHLLKNKFSNRQKLKVTKSVINNLLDQKIIRKIEYNTIKSNTVGEINHKKFHLSDNQKKVFNNILHSNNKPHLLHGLSASGKTEIYLHLALEEFKKGNQTLILAPELTLTHYLVHYFKKFFPQAIAILHSKLTESKKQEIWHQIYNEQIKVIVGSRISLFYPYQKLGLIIMDEEHEWSYKSDQAPRYQTKETLLNFNKAFKNHKDQSKNHNIPKIVLGSATPSIESYYLAKKNIINLNYLKKDINETTIKTTVADMREEFHRANFSMFSEKLQNQISQTFNNKKQTLIVINRRGYASTVVCRDCGHTVKCDNCKVPITLYKNEVANRFFCHHCMGSKSYLSACPDCGSINIKELGAGTQKVVEEIKKRYPLAKVLQVDGGTMKNLKKLNKFHEEINNADIIIGTQIAAKGLDLKRCQLSVILLADLELGFPDYNSSERAYQLFVQTRGRAGRHQDGQFIIQTYQPEHPVIQAASAAELNENNYLKFYNSELSFRKELCYPPFSQIARLNIKDSDENKAKNLTLEVEKQLKNATGNLEKKYENQIHKSPDLIYRKKGLYNWHILIRSQNPQKLINYIKKYNTTVDINPLSTL